MIAKIKKHCSMPSIRIDPSSVGGFEVCMHRTCLQGFTVRHLAKEWVRIMGNVSIYKRTPLIFQWKFCSAKLNKCAFESQPQILSCWKSVYMLVHKSYQSMILKGRKVNLKCCKKIFIYGGRKNTFIIIMKMKKCQVYQFIVIFNVIYLGIKNGEYFFFNIHGSEGNIFQKQLIY